MIRVFSWREQLIVEVDGGFRLNETDEVFPQIDFAIAAIETEMKGDQEAELICVLHNNLYWQCECGRHIIGLQSRMEAGKWLSHNLVSLIQQCEMMKFGNDGQPDGRADSSMQVANCGPLYGGRWENVGLTVELRNGVRFNVDIEVVE